jgi:hypothetical protein
MPANLLARNFSLPHNLVQRGLRYLEVGRQLVNGQNRAEFLIHGNHLHRNHLSAIDPAKNKGKGKDSFSSTASTSPATREIPRHGNSSDWRSLQLVIVAVKRFPAAAWTKDKKDPAGPSRRSPALGRRGPYEKVRSP